MSPTIHTVRKASTLSRTRIASCMPLSLKRSFISGDPYGKEDRNVKPLCVKTSKRTMKHFPHKGSANTHKEWPKVCFKIPKWVPGGKKKLPRARDGLRNFWCAMPRRPSSQRAWCRRKNHETLPLLCCICHKCRKRLKQGTVCLPESSWLRLPCFGSL